MAIGADAALRTRGFVNAACTSLLMVCVVVILTAAIRRWLAAWPAPQEPVSSRPT
jgi:hypothetical protein